MKELGIPDLTNDQIEQLCLIAEAAARQYVLSKVPFKELENMEIAVEAEGEKPVRLVVDIDIVPITCVKNDTMQKITNAALKAAFNAGEEYLRKLRCRSEK